MYMYMVKSQVAQSSMDEIHTCTMCMYVSFFL